MAASYFRAQASRITRSATAEVLGTGGAACKNADRLDDQAATAVLHVAGHRVPRRRGGLAGLPPREVEVLRLVARGLSNKDIARRLVISPKTAGNHIEHIYAKIDASSRSTASLFAMQHGLLPEEELPAAVFT